MKVADAVVRVAGAVAKVVDDVVKKKGKSHWLFGG